MSKLFSLLCFLLSFFTQLFSQLFTQLSQTSLQLLSQVYFQRKTPKNNRGTCYYIAAENKHLTTNLWYNHIDIDIY